MERKNKAYKFRIYPNQEQRVLLAKTFGSVRLVYNHYLELKTQTYEETGKSLSYSKCAADLVKYKRENEFLMEVDSIALQQTLRHLDTAFQNFFRDKKAGYPKYKTKKNHHYSYSTVCVNNNIRLEDKKIVLPKVGKVRIKQHREIPEGWELKSATVSQTPTGKYYVSILYEYETEVQSVEVKKTVGLDYSMRKLFVSSEEELKTDEELLHQYDKTMQKLAKAQRILSKRTKGSKRYIKQRKRVSLIQEKITNQRRDYLQKLSRQIANAYDMVFVEDLNMKEMAQAEGMDFGKSIADNAWGKFQEMLRYKLEGEGKKLVKIDKWYASSKTCHCCGYINNDLTLAMRKWECPQCHKVHDRDKNAAMNIKAEGMRIAFG